MRRSARVIGNGRAGRAFATALEEAGWRIEGPLGRADDVAPAGAGVAVVLIAVPDEAVAEVATAIDPSGGAVVAHVAGSVGLDVLAPHPRRASVHPLVAIPPPPVGAERLAAGGWFAVAASSPEARAPADAVVSSLRGRIVEVDEGRRAAYHAAACMASNHLVALLGQVERVGAAAGVPLAAYLDLVRASVENVAELGPAGALTGPVARGDWGTVARHLAAIDPSERRAYEVLAAQARRLVDPAFDPGGGLPPPAGRPT